MRNDVKTLLMALKAERSAIDRAIAGLQQMSEFHVEPVLAKPVAQKRRRGTRVPVDASLKGTIYAVMSEADATGAILSREARSLAARTGVKASTITSNWRTWNLFAAYGPIEANGNVAAEPTPELAGAIA